MSEDIPSSSEMAYSMAAMWPEWMKRDPGPACQTEPPGRRLHLFFPEFGGTTPAEELARTVKRAKRICFGCPVRWECLEASLVNEDAHGIFGGTTPAERSEIRSGGVPIEEALSWLEPQLEPVSLLAERRTA